MILPFSTIGMCSSTRFLEQRSDRIHRIRWLAYDGGGVGHGLDGSLQIDMAKNSSADVTICNDSQQLFAVIDHERDLKAPLIDDPDCIAD